MPSHKELEDEFAVACEDVSGKLLWRMGYYDCLLTKKPLFRLAISLHSGAPNVKVELGGLNEVEIYNIQSIKSNKMPRRIEIRNDSGHIHIRPDVGLVTFHGDIKGSMMEHSSFGSE